MGGIWNTPYSLDLTSSDYHHLLGPRKNICVVKDFTLSKRATGLHCLAEDFDTKFFSDETDELIIQWIKYLDKFGDYVEVSVHIHV